MWQVGAAGIILSNQSGTALIWGHLHHSEQCWATRPLQNCIFLACSCGLCTQHTINIVYFRVKYGRRNHTRAWQRRRWVDARGRVASSAMKGGKRVRIGTGSRVSSERGAVKRRLLVTKQVDWPTE